jgi:hypothetical protein
LHSVDADVDVDLDIGDLDHDDRGVGPVVCQPLRGDNDRDRVGDAKRGSLSQACSSSWPGWQGFEEMVEEEWRVLMGLRRAMVLT